MRKKIMHYYRALKRRLLSPERYAKWLGVKVGEGCIIDTKNWPTEPYLIELGDFVRVAKGTSFYTHGGLVSLRKYYHDNNIDQFGKIKVGNYSYIGERCMIMQGVTIGERCIIGGGSVVTHSVPDGCMVAGNPARFIGYSEVFYNRIKQTNNVHCHGMTYDQKRDYLLSLSDDSFSHKKTIAIP